MKNTRNLVYLSLFIVLEVILTQYLGLTLPTMRFTFTFIVMAVCGYLFGPLRGSAVAIIADLLGMVLYPKGPFFIGFTLASAISGFLFGLLHEKKGKRLTIAVVVVTIANTLIANVLVTSFSLTVITQLPLEAFIAPRLIKAGVELPLRILILIPLLKQMEKFKGNFNI